MTRKMFMFPMMEGKEVCRTDEREKNMLEIYDLEIKGIHKYWRNSPDNKYNTYQIKILELLGIPFKYVGETKLQFQNCVRGSDVFGYMKEIFEMKKEGNSFAKDLLICSWGEFCREKSFTVPITELRDDQINNVVEWCLEKNLAYVNTDGERHYKHATARIKPFILSYQRWQLLKNIVIPLEKSGYEVYKIKTDGVLTNAPEEEMSKIYKLGSDIGQLKVEKNYTGKFEIINTIVLNEL